MFVLYNKVLFFLQSHLVTSRNILSKRERATFSFFLFPEDINLKWINILLTKNDEQKKKTMISWEILTHRLIKSNLKIGITFFYAYLFYLHVSKAMKMNDWTMNRRSSVHANVGQSTNEDIMHCSDIQRTQRTAVRLLSKKSAC